MKWRRARGALAAQNRKSPGLPRRKGLGAVRWCSRFAIRNIQSHLRSRGVTLSDASPERICRRVVVTGRVQGVYFRGSTEAFALSENLTGWVRNLPDGSVEAIFEGPRDAVERAVAFCRIGPRWASVERVDVKEQPPEGFSGFRVR